MRILLPTDSSNTSFKAAMFAIDLVRYCGQHLHPRAYLFETHVRQRVVAADR